MNDAVLEAEPVDEGLERRARRAHGVGHVDLAGALILEIAGGADPGEHLAARMIDGEDRDRDVRPERPGALARERLEARLPRAVDGEADQRTARHRRHGLVGGMGGEHRHRRASCRHRLGLRLRDLGVGEQAARRDAVEHAVARAPRRLGGAVRPPRLRRLRQRDEQRRLAERQPPRLLAEIGERGGADAFEIAAIGREAQVKGEHLVLGQRALELDGAHDLAELGDERTLAPRLEETRHLHRQGRAAGHDVAGWLTICPAARRKRGGIDAGMAAEALVLVGDQQREITRIDAVGLRRQPPAAFGRRVGPQQPAVAIDHGGREFELACRAAPDRANRSRERRLRR